METVEPAIVRAAAGQALSRREFGAIAASGLAASVRQRATVGVQSDSFRDRSLADAIAGMQKLGLRSCELWQDHVEPRKMPRQDLRRWRETVSLDHFHRIREQLSRASITLSAYNISIKDNFSDAEIERAFDMTAALGAPLVTFSSNIATTKRIAPVAERRKMLVGMHNHSRIDPNEFATAKSLADAPIG